MAKVLATNTNYAAMVAVPQYKGSTLKFIQLSRVNERQLIAVVVCEGNVIRNQIINIDEEMDDQTILKLNLLLNTNLNGVPIQDINLGMIARLKEQAGSHSGVVARCAGRSCSYDSRGRRRYESIYIGERPTYLSIQSLQIHPSQ